MNIVYFHRNKSAGFSINKVTQTIINKIDNKIEYYMPVHGGNPLKIIKNIIFTFKNRTNNGINHITGDIHYCILGLLGCKSVLTVHDLVWMDFLDLPKIKKCTIKWLYLKLPLKFATQIIAISETTRNKLLPYCKNKNIEVIHNAIDYSFYTSLKDCNVPPYNILFIGTNPNKNLERTVLALEGLDCRLTIIGKLSDSQVRFLNESNIDFINKINLTDQEIVDEYINADIVSFISLYEGFGMPIIEANKVGRPVIASSLEVLKEIGGNSCVFVDPRNVEDMRHGFIRLFEDSELRRQCVEFGLENVKRFAPDFIRQQWVNVYQRIE